MTQPRPPNLLIVVMDCMRADDFPGSPTAVTGMPVAEALRKESWVFPRAASPCSWTIPSHASLFTGLYPWEHGAHAKGNLQLGAMVPRVPQLLRQLGYRTLSLSANHLVSPALGLVDGFDRCGWAGWWEPYYRPGPRPAPPHLSGVVEGNGTSQLEKLRQGPAWRLLKRSSRAVYRFPFLLDAAGRVVRHLTAPESNGELAISPWIEPTLERWLADTPADQPVFGFINLLEAHEPYYPDHELAKGLLDWWRYSRTRQDGVGWLAGRWEPSTSDLARLRTMCREMVRALDRRLGRIVQVMRDAGRWDNTALVLTSDHGQAFGEHGMLFHMLRLNESLVRIPLWYRPPGGVGGGRVGKGWASLVDVAPTLLEAAGDSGALLSSGLPLDHLLDTPRPSPAFSVADGLVWTTIIPEHERGRLSARRRAEFDHIWVAGYQGSRKLLYQAGREPPALYDIDADPGEEVDLWPTEGGRFTELSEETRRIARQLTESRTPPTPPDVEDRLRSWGYI